MAALPETCPTCTAPMKGMACCRRCKTDLRPLVVLEEEYQKSLVATRRAYTADDPEGMFFHARRCHGLRRNAESIRQLACSALLTGRFDLALCLWAKIPGSGAGSALRRRTRD